MESAFAQSLAEWTAFYALMGGAAATLLGLLFVAVSLRLNIFHQRQVADVRAFAAFTLGAFLVAIALAALALAPHLQPLSLALPLAVAGVAGLLAAAAVARLWMRLNLPAAGAGRDATRLERQGVVYLLVMAGPYAGLIVVAVLVWREHAAALGLLAIIEGALLALGTGAAWLMISHAHAAGDSSDP